MTMSSDVSLSGLLFSLAQQLESGGIDNARNEARMLLEYSAGQSREYLMLHGADMAEMELCRKAGELAERRICGEPLQYILGEWEFMGMNFYVGDGVLIPRPETEILAEKAIEVIGGSSKIVFDICAGSGCIGISIAKSCSKATVYALEKFDGAYGYLLKNIERYGLTNVIPVKGDMFSGFEGFSLPKPDIILSNPPYIKSSEIVSLQREVLFEPRTAQDGGEDGLRFYRALAEGWLPFLNCRGFAAAECGENQACDVEKMFSTIGTPKIIKDLGGIQRVVAVGRDESKCC